MIHIKLNAGGKCQHVDFQLMNVTKNKVTTQLKWHKKLIDQQSAFKVIMVMYHVIIDNRVRYTILLVNTDSTQRQQLKP